MGGGRWKDSDWTKYASKHIDSKDSVDEIYTARSLDEALDPKGVKFRESCDSEDNPNSTPIIVALDVTGSMGFILDEIAREGLKTLATEIYNKKPVSDPHIMFMGVGDVKCDRAPLQVTQFEADIRIAEQLTKIYLEQGGGGNNSESYTLPWWFAYYHTKIDSIIKRGKKGYLFTIGDEEPPKELLAREIDRVLGYTPEVKAMDSKSLLDLVSRSYEVFHIVTEEGWHFGHYPKEVTKEWIKLLGQRVIFLKDHTKLAEVIVSTLQLMNGVDKEEVISGWDGSTAIVVKDALNKLVSVKKEDSGVIRF